MDKDAISPNRLLNAAAHPRVLRDELNSCGRRELKNTKFRQIP
jgi:hypothetical protein